MYKRKWKYRIRTQPDGTRRFYVLVDGVFTEVDESVFRFLDSSDAKEDYETEKRIQRRDTYLEFIRKRAGADIADNLSAEESAEDTAVKSETQRTMSNIIRLLPAMVDRLPEEERDAIRSLYRGGMSLRRFADLKGITVRQVLKRKNSGIAMLRADIYRTFGRYVDEDDLFDGVL